MRQILIITFIAISTELLAQDRIPEGTILPVRLNSSLRSDKAREGQRVEARMMQDVPLPGGGKIREGTKVLGHIVSVEARTTSRPAEITLRFDTLDSNHRNLHVSTDLRALASMMAIEDAQVPRTGSDRGTPWTWATRNLIGGEVAYGEGPVARGTEIIGQATANGVLAPVKSNPAAGCPGEVPGTVQAQALWVFSSDACGLYDLPNLTLRHAGRTPPLGQITLIAQQGNVKVPGGSGMLLRVNASAQ